MEHTQKVGKTSRSPGFHLKMRALMPPGPGSDYLANGNGNLLPKARMGASIRGEISGMLLLSPFRTRAARCAVPMPFPLIRMERAPTESWTWLAMYGNGRMNLLMSIRAAEFCEAEAITIRRARSGISLKPIN